jgi:hypothetical protein
MRKRVRVRPQETAPSSLYLCDLCGATERIPSDVIDYFDEIDPGEPGAPPTFQCQQCLGIMYPDWWFRAERATQKA